jgi:hypothetical protein
MSEADMRTAFIGKTIDGYYASGLAFSETYRADGRLDYREPARRAEGQWHFRGAVFCTFYDPPYLPLVGGCWSVTRLGANCYEFHAFDRAAGQPREDDLPNAKSWTARGWRQGEASTCEAKPSV